MNKTTVKISVLAFLGFMTYGYAQQQQQDPYKGKVGVNTITPSATMDIRPSTANAQKEATTNEGIIAPKLSKTRIANIETPVEGTLVYATDETTSPISAYTGGDTKVAKIAEKGYYFYNGTEWVKAGSDVNSGEWVHNGTDAIHAKRAKDGATSNLFEILDNGRTYINQGNVNWNEVYFTAEGLPSVSEDPRNSVPNLKLQSSATLPLRDISINGKLPNVKGYSFNDNKAYVYQAHAGVAEGSKKSYLGNSYSLDFKDVSSPLFYTHALGASNIVSQDVSAAVEHLRGISASARHLGTGIVNNAVGGYFESYAEGTGNTVNAVALRTDAYLRKDGKASNLVGGYFRAVLQENDNATAKLPVARGAQVVLQMADSNKTNLGEASATYIANSLYSEANIDRVFGIRGENNIGTNTQVLNEISGINYINKLESSKDIPIVLGIKATNSITGSGNIGQLTGYYSHLHNTKNSNKIPTNANIQNYYAFHANNDLEPGTYTGTITNSYDFYSDANPVSNQTTNQYGIYIEGVAKTNYLQGKLGIGTTTPTEKLDVAGNIKSSSLASNAGNRHVYADANGVLKIGTNDVTTLASLWTEDVTNNSIKLAVNSDGSTRSNVVSILDDGKVHASSFMGTNGATIFPDYVFQKYYTGTSSIKADYNFKSLSQVEDFVKANGHLPGYKSAATIKAQGYVDLMETQLTNVEKIEELYLHSIEQDKVNKQQAEALKAKDAEIADLKQRLERLEKLIQ
ncbi:hypothetical protein [Bergeyella zoohelcum]|uniref:Uncharacterized protein n=1 Tax=Bergeyella zoohelcum TaxID=1015 RepID=A0A7Z8YNT3_9FLAO|nr:hypothetical protein [Bergeyella zoohelcum]VDH04579.1 Uncharacterised protein [Bergeyella zoohelcum]